MHIHAYVHVHILTLARLSCICMFKAMKIGDSSEESDSEEYVLIKINAQIIQNNQKFKVKQKWGSITAVNKE